MDGKSGDRPVKHGASKRRDKGKKGERGGIGREATLGAHCLRFWWLQLIVITVVPLTFLLPLYVFHLEFYICLWLTINCGLS